MCKVNQSLRMEDPYPQGLGVNGSEDARFFPPLPGFSPLHEYVYGMYTYSMQLCAGKTEQHMKWDSFSRVRRSLS